MKKLEEKIITDDSVILIYSHDGKSLAECSSCEVIPRKKNSE